MATLTIENATLIFKSEVRRGNGANGSWSSQEFVVEYQDSQYPAKAVFSVFGDDKVNNLARYNIGERLNVSFNLSAREYNGRWYGEARAWRIEAVPGQATPRRGTAPQAQRPASPQPQRYTPPQPAPQAPAFGNNAEEDDLPF